MTKKQTYTRKLEFSQRHRQILRPVHQSQHGNGPRLDARRLHRCWSKNSCVSCSTMPHFSSGKVREACKNMSGHPRNLLVVICTILLKQFLDTSHTFEPETLQVEPHL